jgi:hypothetical protein
MIAIAGGHLQSPDISLGYDMSKEAYRGGKMP